MAHVAASLNSYSLSAKVIAAPPIFGGGLHSAKCTESRPRRSISDPLAGEPTHVFRFHCDIFHIVRACSHIFCSDVAASQPLDEAAVGAEQLLTVSRLVAADYD